MVSGQIDDNTPGALVKGGNGALEAYRPPPWVLTRKQMAFLLAHAERRTEPLAVVLRAAGVSKWAYRVWRKDRCFMALYELHRRDARAAADFLLANTQADAAAALRATLRDPNTGELRTGRTATDAASVVFREWRERGVAAERNALAEAVERALERYGRERGPSGAAEVVPGEYRDVP